MTIGIRCLTELSGNKVEGLFPTDLLELPRSSFARANQRTPEPVGRIHSLWHLISPNASRHVTVPVGIVANLLQTAILHMRNKRTSAAAILVA